MLYTKQFCNVKKLSCLGLVVCVMQAATLFIILLDW